MASKSEQNAARGLRPILSERSEGSEIAESKAFRDVLSALQWFVPQVLREIHSEWERESLDAIYPVQARKLGVDTAEIFGLCMYLSDQSLKPIHLRFQLAESTDEVSWLECRLGDRARPRYGRLSAEIKRLLVDLTRIPDIDWIYKVTFGERRA